MGLDTQDAAALRRKLAIYRKGSVNFERDQRGLHPDRMLRSAEGEVAAAKRARQTKRGFFLRDRAVRLPARRDDTFKRAAREEDRGAQGALDL
jgi:hypothetical protein